MLNIFKLLVSVNLLCLTYGALLTQKCGKSYNISQPNWRVVGGTDAAIGEFPWQVILTLAQENKFIPDANNFCGGTIINERWILTAGHCTNHRLVSTLKLRLGVHNYKVNETNIEVDISVEKIIHHENFVQTTFAVANDISLIKLKESLDFNVKHKHLSPICLARSDTKLTDKCVATGFGYINTNHQRPINGILQKVDVPYVPVGVCKKIFRHFKETQNVCAGGLAAGGQAVCIGDSGGPLQCQAADGRWYQVGIVSHGKPCALPGIPEVFTKVSFYIDWIVKTISSH